MDRVETSSTSAHTAECSPVVLREKDRVRLVFKPVIVVNDTNSRACIRGEFVYERKSPKDEWQPLNTLSLNSIKFGEEYKLELHSGELLELMETLGPLYRAQWTAGAAPQGKQVFVRMETQLAKFLQLEQKELESFLTSHSKDAIEVLTKLIRWLSSGSLSATASHALAQLEPSRLPAVTALIGLSSLKTALEEWESHSDNGSEAHWQQALSRHAFVLSQLFAHPVVVIQQQAYLGGKAIDNTGGSYLDFLAASTATGGVALIEIKTPKTPLLGSEYRNGVHPASTELNGALAQILKYRHTFATEFHKLGQAKGHDLVLGGTPCVVIAGNAKKELVTKERREAFEAFRCQLTDVRIITFDELFEKLRVSARLLEGLTTQVGTEDAIHGEGEHT